LAGVSGTEATLQRLIGEPVVLGLSGRLAPSPRRAASTSGHWCRAVSGQ
jgi:hypothetical protein